MTVTSTRDIPATTTLSRANDSGNVVLRLAANQEVQQITDSVPPLPLPTKPVSKVLGKDRGTPDDHVPRDSRMIRLTGVHPFNAEPPLADLFSEGFLTSVNLFYVRNHGAVPQVLDEEVLSWELTVEGLVENPLTISVQQLIEEFEQITLPVTLVCAGNRRKEQNVVRKTKGFSWGPAGLSTGLFTGTLMKNVLKKAKPLRTARYVCMEGADKLPNGHYGTSLKLSWVMDGNKGIMLAHGMNGAPLRPDHGRPLRAVVPGQIGGRSVKWLTRIILTEDVSDNWYHYYDNKVLPTSVTPELSTKDPSWWKDDKYAIYDLNVNSAAAAPRHNEVLYPSSSSEDYIVKGYAYSGGGRRVTRVEISLDDGIAWHLAKIDYPEDKYRVANARLYGGGRLDMSSRETCFCWCFWSYSVPIPELVGSKAILVRAMDEAMTCQPRDMYWSVLGMMNNPWFRIAVIKQDDGSLRFEHPTSLTQGTTGWMERIKDAGGDLTNGKWGEINSGDHKQLSAPKANEICLTNDKVKRVFSFDELKSESSPERPLFVLHGEIYDGTNFLREHPGGAQSILAVAGADATEDFMAIHSENAKEMMRDFHVGVLSEDGKKQLQKQGAEEQAENDGTKPEFLFPQRWAKAAFCAKKHVSWDTRLLIFKLEHEHQALGLPVGKHLMLRAKHPQSGNNIVRAYTPISETRQKGTVELLVKVYFESKSSPAGKMTTILDTLPLYSQLEFKGPTGDFEYLGRGTVAVNQTQRRVKSFIMICGGSGITPIFQVFRAIMQDSGDDTVCTIIYGNRTEEDILCREELDALASGNSGQCKLIHTLTKPPVHWKGRCGRISEDLLRERALPAYGGMALVCGPEGMEKSVSATLRELGWLKEDTVFF